MFIYAAAPNWQNTNIIQEPGLYLQSYSTYATCNFSEKCDNSLTQFCNVQSSNPIIIYPPESFLQKYRKSEKNPNNKIEDNRLIHVYLFRYNHFGDEFLVPDKVVFVVIAHQNEIYIYNSEKKIYEVLSDGCTISTKYAYGFCIFKHDKKVAIVKKENMSFQFASFDRNQLIIKKYELHDYIDTVLPTETIIKILSTDSLENKNMQNDSDYVFLFSKNGLNIYLNINTDDIKNYYKEQEIIPDSYIFQITEHQYIQVIQGINNNENLVYFHTIDNNNQVTSILSEDLYKLQYIDSGFQFRKWGLNLMLLQHENSAFVVYQSNGKYNIKSVTDFNSDPNRIKIYRNNIEYLPSLVKKSESPKYHQDKPNYKTYYSLVISSDSVLELDQNNIVNRYYPSSDENKILRNRRGIYQEEEKLKANFYPQNTPNIKNNDVSSLIYNKNRAQELLHQQHENIANAMTIKLLKAKFNRGIKNTKNAKDKNIIRNTISNNQISDTYNKSSDKINFNNQRIKENNETISQLKADELQKKKQLKINNNFVSVFRSCIKIPLIFRNIKKKN